MVGWGVFLFGSTILLLLCIVLDRRSNQDFEKRFSPISDEEFLARCRPGVDAEVALKVRSIFAEFADIDYERVYPSSRIVEDLGLD